MSTKKLAYCGDCCTYCPRFIATLSGSRKKLKDVAFLMKKVGWHYNLDEPEKNKCEGCQDIENCEYGIKECCMERKIENCGKCIDYPCSKVENAFKITEGYVEKFRTILLKEEYELFRKAYFLKKENLEKERV
ncbi:MAG: DUF3795 domain-containing protein [Promethearchaeota archaeon]